MAINGVGSVNGVQTEQIKKNVETGVKQVEDAVNKKDNKQKLALALGALGAVGAATIGIAMKAKKGKVADVADMAQDGVKKLSDIKFEKGIAKQGDNLFTGVIEDTLKSGKKVTLEYTDGKIKKSTIDNNFRNFYYTDNGKLLGKTVGYKNKINHGFVYDPNSKEKKVIKYFQENSITEYAEDGSMKTKYGHFDINNSPLEKLEVKNPKQVVWQDKNGNVLKNIEIKDDLNVINFWEKNTNTDISVKFEDDVITLMGQEDVPNNLKRFVSELLDLLKDEGFEVNNKIKTLFEKL